MKYFRQLPFPPVFLLGGVLLLSLIVSTQSFFADQFFSGKEWKTPPYGINWIVPAVNYSFWAILSPAIYMVAQRISFDRGKLPRSLVVVFLSGLLLAVVHEFTTSGFFFMPKLLSAEDRPKVLSFIDGEYLRYGISTRFMEFLVITVVFLTIDYYKRYTKSKYTIDAITRDLNEARLATLKMQLQPHFLFNTLNTITALIDENKAAAQDVTCKLGNILREVLQTAGEASVPLKQEVELVKNYLDIEQVRYGERLSVQIKLSPEASDTLIPSLILQPLVENSFKHGFRGKDGPCLLTIEGHFQDSTLCLSVVDNGALGSTAIKSGLGLLNIQRRLSHHFGDLATLTHGRSTSGGYRSEIKIKSAA